MNNQYVGDIGDFGKYALLSELSGGLKLAVIWYLTPDNQGKFTRYLNLDTEEYRPGECERNEQMYQSCNPELYKKLGLIVASNKRTVGEIEQKGVLPSNTKYYNHALTKDNREQWFTDAVEAVRDCDLVFLDPNNGFTTTNPTSPGHVQIDEVRRLFDRGQSLIVYHHLERRIEGQAKNGEEQVAY